MRRLLRLVFWRQGNLADRGSSSNEAVGRRCGASGIGTTGVGAKGSGVRRRRTRAADPVNGRADADLEFIRWRFCPAAPGSAVIGFALLDGLPSFCDGFGSADMDPRSVVATFVPGSWRHPRSGMGRTLMGSLWTAGLVNGWPPPLVGGSLQTTKGSGLLLGAPGALAGATRIPVSLGHQVTSSEFCSHHWVLAFSLWPSPQRRPHPWEHPTAAVGFGALPWGQRHLALGLCS